MHARSREQDPAGRHADHADRSPATVEHHDVDRETHPDGVDRAAVVQHEGVPLWQIGTAEEPSPTFRPRLREQQRPVPERHPFHGVTVAGGADADQSSTVSPR